MEYLTEDEDVFEWKPQYIPRAKMERELASGTEIRPNYAEKEEEDVD